MSDFFNYPDTMEKVLRIDLNAVISSSHGTHLQIKDNNASYNYKSVLIKH